MVNDSYQQLSSFSKTLTDDFSKVFLQYGYIIFPFYCKCGSVKSIEIESVQTKKRNYKILKCKDCGYTYKVRITNLKNKEEI